MKYYIGIDLGGTNIAIGLVDKNGIIKMKSSIPTIAGRSYKEIVLDMVKLINELLNKSDCSTSDIGAIGIGSPGVVDKLNNKVVYSCNLNFENVPLVEELNCYFNCPIFIDNDANCAALGESKVGASKGTDSSVMITIGTGIGGGIIKDSKIYSGFNYAGGEIGHIVIDLNGRLCKCGRKGCWEKYASASALVEDAKRALLNEEHLKENLNAKLIFDFAKSGNTTFQLVLKEYFYYLATGIVNIINVFQPSMVVIGGGISKEGNYLIEPITNYIEKEVYTKDFAKYGLSQTRITTAQLGGDAGIVGAALLAK